MRNKSSFHFTSPTAGFLGELGPEVERVDVVRDSSLESDDSYSCGGDWQLCGIGGIVWQMKETLIRLHSWNPHVWREHTRIHSCTNLKSDVFFFR